MFHLSRVLARASSLYANDTAVVSGDTRLTYAELVGRVFRLANGLRAAGLTQSERIAVLDRNAWTIAIALADYLEEAESTQSVRTAMDGSTTDARRAGTTFASVLTANSVTMAAIHARRWSRLEG